MSARRELCAEVTLTAGAFTLTAGLSAAPGEIVAVLGPNGAGKSTLLAALAGHRMIQRGTIRIGERLLDGPRVHVAPARRRVGLLGQRALLFPHLSALENVAFAPRSQGIHRAAARADARVWLERVGLADLADRRAAALSGGQQQRVAIARAFAASPDAMLLDEPFAALDVQTAAQARRVVAQVATAAGIPIVLVTHDPQDARELATRTIILQSGRVVDAGPTRAVLDRESTAFVAALGSPVAWTATVAETSQVGDVLHLRTVEHPDTPFVVPTAAAASLVPGTRLRLTLSPEPMPLGGRDAATDSAGTDATVVDP